ncbi:hypothetical protein [Aquimarina algiphila]|uniref:hypothetical protein n=1 Tax=Aquimarina algiphila TaxID=2047982 RepID=UPI002492640A|nr:hypothetical protein [Aquimarina algiphila]
MKCFNFILLLSILIISCKQDNNLSPVDINITEETAKQLKGDIFLNINTKKDRFQLCHVEAKGIVPFVLLAKAKATKINEDSCKLKNITITAQGFRGKNYYYVKDILQPVKRDNANIYDLTVLIDKVHRNNPECKPFKLCEFQVPLHGLTIDKNTIFDYKIKTTKKLSVFLNTYYKNKKHFPENIIGCCGVVCKSKFIF